MSISLLWTAPFVPECFIHPDLGVLCALLLYLVESLLSKPGFFFQKINNMQEQAGIHQSTSAQQESNIRAPVLLSVYSRPESVSRCPLIEVNLSRLLSLHPLHIVGGDFNCGLNSNLDTVDGQMSVWPWVAKKTSGPNPQWINTYRLTHPHQQSWTRPRSCERLDYVFMCRSLFRNLKLLDACIDYGDFYSDHHPVLAQVESPPIPDHAPPPPPAPVPTSTSKGSPWPSGQIAASG